MASTRSSLTSPLPPPHCADENPHHDPARPDSFLHEAATNTIGVTPATTISDLFTKRVLFSLDRGLRLLDGGLEGVALGVFFPSLVRAPLQIMLQAFLFLLGV